MVDQLDYMEQSDGGATRLHRSSLLGGATTRSSPLVEQLSHLEQSTGGVHRKQGWS